MPRTASSAAASLSSRRSTSRKSGSHETHRWRKPDSNHRSRSYDRVSTVAEGRYRTDKPDGVIFARRRRLAADPPLSTAVSFTGGTDRSYGVGGEEVATSSLHLTMECRDAPAERPEQVPRRPGP